MDDPTFTMEGGSRPSADQPQWWGPFRLIEKVGQGGFGEVYRAWDTMLEREVALKLLLPRAGWESDDKAILREARSLARVRHSNVVSVYGVDRHDNRVGFWSDFVKGKTLSALITAQGPFGAREAAQIGIELCKALSAVHAAGLLHRDIKTGNVMREEGGRILLMDFGLTHESGNGPGFAGTVTYMAPELWAGEPATVRSDIYALGILLFNLVTGKYPIESERLRADAQAVFESGERRHLMEERPDLPEDFVRVVETAIDPKKRFGTVGELYAALSDAAGTGAPRSEASFVSPAPPRSRWFRAGMIWPVLVLAGFLLTMTPLRNLLPFRSGARIAASGAHEDYLQAMDLLDHYYKPHAIEQATKGFEKAAAEEPKFALAFAGLGRAIWYQYRDTRNSSFIEPARAACERALALDPNLASVHVTLGMIYTQTGRNDLAAEELQQALRLDSRSADAYGALAELYQKQGRDAEVEPNLQKAVDLAPTQWRWRNQLGLYYMSGAKLEAAASQFQEAAKVAPDNARAYNNLGIIYRREDRLAESRAAFEKAIQLDPSSNPAAYLNLGRVLEAQGHYSEAATMYQRSADMNPANYVSWGNLAQVQAMLQGGTKQARETYLKAISVAEEFRKGAPANAAVIASLGSYYACVEMPQESLPLLRQALALAPEDPDILYLVGEGYELLHQRDEALHWIAKALERGYSRKAVLADPELTALRADTRFAALHEKLR